MFKNLTMDFLARPCRLLCTIFVGKRFFRRWWEHGSVVNVQLWIRRQSLPRFTRTSCGAPRRRKKGAAEMFKNLTMDPPAELPSLHTHIFRRERHIHPGGHHSGHHSGHPCLLRPRSRLAQWAPFSDRFFCCCEQTNNLSEKGAHCAKRERGRRRQGCPLWCPLWCPLGWPPRWTSCSGTVRWPRCAGWPGSLHAVCRPPRPTGLASPEWPPEWPPLPFAAPLAFGRVATLL